MRSEARHARYSKCTTNHAFVFIQERYKVAMRTATYVKQRIKLFDNKL